LSLRPPCQRIEVRGRSRWSARVFRSELVVGSGGRGARPCLRLALYILGADGPRLRQSPRYRSLGSGNGPARRGKLGAGIQGSAEATGSSRDGNEPLRLRRDLCRLHLCRATATIRSRHSRGQPAGDVTSVWDRRRDRTNCRWPGRGWESAAVVVGMFVALAILYGALAAFIGKSAPVWAAMVAWGFLFLAPCIPLQARVVRAAKEEPNLASTLTSPPSMWATRWARRWAPRHFPSDLVIGGCRCSEH
jgi:hypothetical protein